jgi:hypothetical protein
MLKRASKKITNSIPNVLVSLTAPGEAALSASRPETFRLPKTNSGGDPFFHFTRSFYYLGEQRGYWRLIRIRERGKQRGITLVPFDAVARFVKSQMENSNEAT